MESLLKAKTLELEQVSATCQNLQWLKEEMEAKSSCWQKEQEGVIQQLQTTLHDRNKEVEVRAMLLAAVPPASPSFGGVPEHYCQASGPLIQYHCAILLFSEGVSDPWPSFGGGKGVKFSPAVLHSGIPQCVTFVNFCAPWSSAWGCRSGAM